MRLLPIHQGTRTDSHGIPALKTGNGMVCSDADKAECLNDYFASVFTIENKSSIPVILPTIYPDIPAFKVTSLWLRFQKVTRYRWHITSSYERNTQWNFWNTQLYIQPVTKVRCSLYVVPTNWRIANMFALHKKWVSAPMWQFSTLAKHLTLFPTSAC